MKKKMIYVEPAEYFTPEMRKILEVGESKKVSNKKAITQKLTVKKDTKEHVKNLPFSYNNN